MEQRSLGRSDVKITPIIMGTWQAGKRGWVGIQDVETIKAIRAAFDAGITTFDTAEVYGQGHSESIVAQALSDVRDQVIYATKVFANHMRHDQVIKACENSLKNLKTEWIDLYQIHWPSGSFNSEVVPIEETMGAMNELKEQGKIRAIGVSNFSRSQLAEATQLGQVDSLQPPYSLFWRGVEQDAMPFCIENNISIIAYSSLAQGLLTGKFGPNHKFPSEDIRAKNRLFQEENYQRAQRALEQLRPIAEKYQTSLASLALAWLIAQPQSSAIVGARNSEQAGQNAKAAEIKLSQTDLEAMDKISHSVTTYLDSNPVMWEFAS